MYTKFVREIHHANAELLEKRKKEYKKNEV